MDTPEDREQDLRLAIRQIVNLLETQGKIIEQRSILKMPLMEELVERNNLEFMLADYTKRLNALVGEGSAAAHDQNIGSGSA